MNASLQVQTYKDEEISSELIIYPIYESFVLAHRVNTFAKKTVTNWLVFVDATTGEIIDKVNRSNTGLTFDNETIANDKIKAIKFSEDKSETTRRTVLAEGSIFPSYPGTQQDNTDLERLDGTGSKLAGEYVEVFNDEYDAGCSFNCPVDTYQAVPTGSSGNYVYNFDTDGAIPANAESEFDEVNLYYHVDSFRNDFIEQIDAGGLGFTKVKAHAHSAINSNASHSYNGDNYHHLYFGDNSGIGNPFAWEDKVIYHEYMHAVTYDINSQIGSSSNEEGAINEAISDYMAGSYVSRARIFNYSMSHDINEQRDMSLPHIACYSSGCSEPYNDNPPVGAHEGGEFFSSILWDIRNAGGGITTSETNILVYDALYYLDSNPNFEEFVIAMLTADAVAYSGDHADIIIDKFDAKGIDIATSVSGTITSNTTWDGIIELTGTVYVDNNVELTIDPGTVVRLDDNKSLVVSPGGKLTVNGTELSPVVFERLDPAKDWNKISLESSSGNSIEWALFDGGYINLSIESKNNTIEHSTFLNATHRAIQGWTNQDGSGNASATISYSLINGSPSSGIVANYLDLNLNNTTIKNSDDDGLYINAATVYPFYQNLITNNGYANFRDGVQVTSSGTFYMLGSSYVEGYNEISDNSEDQIYNLGDTIVGDALGGDGGYNSVKGGFLGSTYLVNTNSSVNATGTWWGQSSTSPSMFNGTVSGTHLTTDPTTSPGNDGKSPSKVVPIEPIDFESLFDDSEQRLANADNTLVMKDRFHRLYQVEGLANDPVVTRRFQSMAQNAAQGLRANYSSQSLNEAFRELAKVLYTKSLIRNENYTGAQTYLDQMDPSEISGEHREDYLHLRMITETYHGLYEQAKSTLEELYTVQQANGEDIQELKARYLPIEEDILARLNDNEGYINGGQKKSVEINKEEFNLQNHPNPFNPATTISFILPEQSFVSLKVFDLLGREVAELIDGIKTQGAHTARLDASQLSSGMYVYQLKVGNTIVTKMMTLIK